MLVVDADASMTSISDAAAPLPPLPLPTVTPPPAPPLAIARRSSDTAPGDVAMPRTRPTIPTPPAPPLLLEPLTLITLPTVPMAVAVRFMKVPVQVASIDEIAVTPGTAEKLPPFPPPWAVELMF